MRTPPCARDPDDDDAGIGEKLDREAPSWGHDRISKVEVVRRVRECLADADDWLTTNEIHRSTRCHLNSVSIYMGELHGAGEVEWRTNPKRGNGLQWRMP